MGRGVVPLPDSRMCNDYRLEVEVVAIFEGFADPKIETCFPESMPSIEARQDIKIADSASIVRTIDGGPKVGDLVQRRWSRPGQNRRPVYNFRSDGRELTTWRCLVIAGGFYEFTEPADRKKKRKGEGLFTKTGEPWFCIAGIWRADKNVGEAFHAEDAARFRYHALSWSTDCDSRPGRLGAVARSLTVIEDPPEAAPGG